MNYLKNINAFEQFAELNELGDKAYRLWHALMSIDNACAWASWFTAPRLRLMSKIKASSPNTLYAARDELVASGLLQFRKGSRGQAPKYHLVPLVQSTEPNTAPNSEPNHEPLNKPDKTKLDKTNTHKAPRGKKSKSDKPKFDPIVEKQVDQVIDHLNERLGNKQGEGFRKSTDSTRRVIRARIKQNSYLACIAVIDVKADDWLGGNYEKYLRPSTLFRPSKFEEYLTQARQEYRRKHNHKMTDRERDQKELEHLADQYSF